MHNEALLRPREGKQQAPVKVGVRDAQVREWLWLAPVTRRLGDFANHRYILLYAADRMYAIRRSSPTCPRPDSRPDMGHQFSLASERQSKFDVQV
jgi:hypothetical protein